MLWNPAFWKGNIRPILPVGTASHLNPESDGLRKIDDNQYPIENGQSGMIIRIAQNGVKSKSG